MRSVRSATWVALLLVASVAIAGLVMALDHPESGGARPELVAVDSRVLRPRLAAIEPALATMDAAADDLGAAAVDVLEALRAGSPEPLTGALRGGDEALGRLVDAARVVREAAPGLLAGLDDRSRLPALDRERVRAVGRAVAGVDAIDAAWVRAVDAARLPTAIVSVLADHASAVDLATGAGRAGRYSDALAAMAAAGDALREATRVRERATAAGRPSDALDGLLHRLASRDATLEVLYAALSASGGARTPEAEAALATAEATAVDPASAREELATVVEDLGAFALTDALLAIDDGRGAIMTALGTGARTHD